MKSLVKDANPLLEAVHLATRKLAEAGDVNVILRDVLSICIEAANAEGGTIYLHEPSLRRLRFLHVLPDDVAERLERLDIPDDFGIAGRAFSTGKSIVSNFANEGDPTSRDIKEKSGVTVRSMLTIPLQIKGMDPIGVVQLVNKRGGSFSEQDESVLETISDVCTLSVINSRLADRSAYVASLEGMGRAAHDLANKAGVLMTFLPDFERNLEGLRGALKLQGVRGEAAFYLDSLDGTFKDVFAPYSERVFRYARLVNDLAAGKKLQPKLRRNSLSHVVEEAVQFMEPQARRSHVQLECELDYQAPEFQFDDLFIIRIVENLVGNSIKAVTDTIPAAWIAENYGDPDAYFSTVKIRTEFTDDKHQISVIDQGPGLSPGRIREILSGQARSGWSQSSGSGLGAKVVLDLTEALGGQVKIHSLLGSGATFTVELPGA